VCVRARVCRRVPTCACVLVCGGGGGGQARKGGCRRALGGDVTRAGRNVRTRTFADARAKGGRTSQAGAAGESFLP